MSNLEKMFIEDAPQQVNELNNVESLSSHVLELQKLEDEMLTVYETMPMDMIG